MLFCWQTRVAFKISYKQHLISYDVKAFAFNLHQTPNITTLNNKIKIKFHSDFLCIQGVHVKERKRGVLFL